jgi:hypothetical protein
LLGWRRNGISSIFFFILIISILTGILGYKKDLDPAYNINWPSWSGEVARWQKDHSYHLRIWPVNKKNTRKDGLGNL